MSFVLQYLLLNHSSSFLFPLLALQELQHNAIFSVPFILMSLIICSHVFLFFLFLSDSRKGIPQYTQLRSLLSTISSISFGIPHLFGIFIKFQSLIILTRNIIKRDNSDLNQDYLSVREKIKSSFRCFTTNHPVTTIDKTKYPASTYFKSIHWLIPNQSF